MLLVYVGRSFGRVFFHVRLPSTSLLCERLVSFRVSPPFVVRQMGANGSLEASFCPRRHSVPLLFFPCLCSFCRSFSVLYVCVRASVCVPRLLLFSALFCFACTYLLAVLPYTMKWAALSRSRLLCTLSSYAKRRSGNWKCRPVVEGTGGTDKEGPVSAAIWRTGAG